MQLRLQGSDGLHAPGDTDTCWRLGAVEKHLHDPMHVYAHVHKYTNKIRYLPWLTHLYKKTVGTIRSV